MPVFETQHVPASNVEASPTHTARLLSTNRVACRQGMSPTQQAMSGARASAGVQAQQQAERRQQTILECQARIRAAQDTIAQTNMLAGTAVNNFATGDKSKLQELLHELVAEQCTAAKQLLTSQQELSQLTAGHEAPAQTGPFGTPVPPPAQHASVPSQPSEHPAQAPAQAQAMQQPLHLALQKLHVSPPAGVVQAFKKAQSTPFGKAAAGAQDAALAAGRHRTSSCSSDDVMGNGDSVAICTVQSANNFNANGGAASKGSGAASPGSDGQHSPSAHAPAAASPADGSSFFASMFQPFSSTGFTAGSNGLVRQESEGPLRSCDSIMGLLPESVLADVLGPLEERSTSAAQSQLMRALSMGTSKPAAANAAGASNAGAAAAEAPTDGASGSESGGGAFNPALIEALLAQKGVDLTTLLQGNGANLEAAISLLTNLQQLASGHSKGSQAASDSGSPTAGAATVPKPLVADGVPPPPRRVRTATEAPMQPPAAGQQPPLPPLTSSPQSARPVHGGAAMHSMPRPPMYHPANMRPPMYAAPQFMYPHPQMLPAAFQMQGLAPRLTSAGMQHAAPMGHMVHYPPPPPAVAAASAAGVPLHGMGVVPMLPQGMAPNAANIPPNVRAMQRKKNYELHRMQIAAMAAQRRNAAAESRMARFGNGSQEDPRRSPHAIQQLGYPFPAGFEPFGAPDRLARPAPGTRPPESNNPSRLFVGNIHSYVDEEMLHEVFSGFGTITDLQVRVLGVAKPPQAQAL